VSLDTVKGMRAAIKEFRLEHLFHRVTGESYANARKEKLESFWFLLYRAQTHIPDIKVDMPRSSLVIEESF
jgi:hypothetical protein